MDRFLRDILVVRWLTYSPCGRWIASCSYDETIRLWDLNNAGQGYVLCEVTAESDAEFGAESEVETDAESEVETDAESEVETDAESNGETDAVSDAESDAESDAVSEVESDGETDAESDVEFEAEFEPYPLAFSPTGAQLALGNKKARVSVYDTQARNLLKTVTLQGETVGVLAYSPNDQELAIGAESSLLFWDLQLKDPGHKLELGSCVTYCIAYSPCGRWIACGFQLDTAVQLCRRQSSDLDAWRRVAVVEAALWAVYSIAWNPVVLLEFVTGSADRCVRVWRISGNDHDDGTISVDLIWGSNIAVLSVDGMRIDGVVGLDDNSWRLLRQNGAVYDTLGFKGDESDLDSDDGGKIGYEEESEDDGNELEDDGNELEDDGDEPEGDESEAEE